MIEMELNLNIFLLFFFSQYILYYDVDVTKLHRLLMPSEKDVKPKLIGNNEKNMKKSLKLDPYTYICLSESLILAFPDHIHSLFALIAWVNSKAMTSLCNCAVSPNIRCPLTHIMNIHVFED